MSEPFSASRAARLMQCPASAHLDKAILGWTPPEVDPTAGQKGVGTALHALLEPIVTLPNAQMQAVSKALAYIAEVRSRRRFQVWAEHSRQATWLDSQPWTTADLVLFTKDELHIIDSKFGKIPVEVVGNEQLLFYLATYIDLAPKAKTATVHIVQPFADNFAEWEVDAPTLQQFINEARIADARITGGDTTFGPSDHCTFCPAYPHSRADKGSPLCPATMKILYPSVIDEDAMLN